MAVSPVPFTNEQLASMETYGEHNWAGAMADMRYVTCVNHTAAVYLTKGPSRSLHFSQGDPLVGPFTECPCPGSDLRVITGDRQH